MYKTSFNSLWSQGAGIIVGSTKKSFRNVTNALYFTCECQFSVCPNTIFFIQRTSLTLFIISHAVCKVHDFFCRCTSQSYIWLLHVNKLALWRRCMFFLKYTKYCNLCPIKEPSNHNPLSPFYFSQIYEQYFR